MHDLRQTTHSIGRCWNGSHLESLLEAHHQETAGTLGKHEDHGVNHCKPLLQLPLNLSMVLT